MMNVLPILKCGMDDVDDPYEIFTGAARRCNTKQSPPAAQSVHEVYNHSTNIRLPRNTRTEELIHGNETLS